MRQARRTGAEPGAFVADAVPVPPKERRNRLYTEFNPSATRLCSQNLAYVLFELLGERACSSLETGAASVMVGATRESARTTEAKAIVSRQGEGKSRKESREVCGRKQE